MLIADPSRCISTNRANSPIQRNFCNFQTNYAIFISFEIYNVLELCNMFMFDWRNHSYLFGLGGAVKPEEEEGDSLTG